MARTKASAKSSKKSVVSPIKKRKRKTNINPNSLANLRPPWKAGEPSPNPDGRPKALGESYKAWLEKINENGVTNAESVAQSIGEQAIAGDVSAAREIARATEGDKMNVQTWQDRVIVLLREKKVTVEQVANEFGADVATDLAIAAGLSGGASSEVRETDSTS